MLALTQALSSKTGEGKSLWPRVEKPYAGMAHWCLQKHIVGIVYWCPKGCLMQELIGFNSSLIPSHLKKNFFQVPGNEASSIPQRVSSILDYSLLENKPMPVLSEFRACHNMSVSKLLVQWWPLVQILFLGGNDKFPNQWCWILRACLSVFVFWNLNSQILKLATLQSLAHSQATWE